MVRLVADILGAPQLSITFAFLNFALHRIFSPPVHALADCHASDKWTGTISIP
jgi:hypothetical protein